MACGLIRRCAALLLGVLVAGTVLAAPGRPAERLVEAGFADPPLPPGLRMADDRLPRAVTEFDPDRGPDVARPPVDARNATASIIDFCPHIDGKLDNTACIQEAVDALCLKADGAGTLLFPAGAPTINAAVGITVRCSGVSIRGAGWGDRDRNTRATRITVVGQGEAPIFNFVAPPGVVSRYSYGGSVEELGFYSTNPTDAGRTAAQTGPMVRFVHCTGCLVRDVYSWNAYRFVVNVGGYMNRVTQAQTEAMALGGEAVLYIGSDAGCGDNIGGCATRGDIFEIDHASFYAATDDGQPGRNTATCIHIQDFAATTWIQHIACNQTHKGLFVDCPTSRSQGACPAFISAFDFESEPNGRTGDHDAAGIDTRDLQEFTCTSCYIYGYGVRTDVRLRVGRFGDAADVQFTGGKFDSAGGDCIVAEVPGFTMMGGVVANCNRDKGSGVGIRVGRSSKSGSGGSAVIHGVHFCFEANMTPTAMGAVSLEPGVDWNVVQGNVERGCAAGVIDRSQGIHNVIGPNAGP